MNNPELCQPGKANALHLSPSTQILNSPGGSVKSEALSYEDKISLLSIALSRVGTRYAAADTLEDQLALLCALSLGSTVLVRTLEVRSATLSLQETLQEVLNRVIAAISLPEDGAPKGAPTELQMG